MPKVSVIIPCYNCEETIDKCLDSLEAQTYKDFQLVAVNDGSTDGTLHKLNDRKNKIPNFLVVDIPNGGVSNARNVGMEKSSGSFVVFVDSDDTVTESYLSDLIVHSDKDLVVTGFTSGRGLLGGGKSIPSKNYVDNSQYLVEALQAGVFGSVWGKLYKRELLQKHGIKMNTKWANYEDEDFNLRYILHCKTIQTSEACNYVYKEPEPGKSYRKTDYLMQSLEFLEIVKRLDNYSVNMDYLNTWLSDRFLMGALQNFFSHTKETIQTSLAIFKNELLPYLPECRLVRIEKRKRALLLKKLLIGRPSMWRIRLAFALVNKI